MSDDGYEAMPAVKSWLIRAYYTPVSDALRGQLSARLDVRREIAAAGLPEALANVIYSVVRRTRLWRKEKSDVARELIAHFADGLEAGRTVEALVKDFGSPEQAARLIRKSKRRNRSLWWQAYHVLSRLFLAALAVSVVSYGVLSARFYWGRPQIAHNYWHDINTAREVPEADRAWPLYREAAIKLGKSDIEPEWFAAGPTSPRWKQAMTELELHRDSIDLCHQAAKKPRLGYYWGDPADRQAAQAAKADWLISSSEPLADANEVLLMAGLGGVQGFRQLARLLLADAQRAAIVGDGTTVVADLTTCLSMSEQIFQPKSSLIEQLVGFAIFDYTLQTAGRILADTPDVLTDAQLRELAHRIAAYRDGTIQVDFSMEQMYFDDLLQRAYTDDGHGNGRFTPSGLKALDEVLPGNENDFGFFRSQKTQAERVGIQLLSPGVAALIGSRQENRELYQSLLNEGIRLHQGPPWTWDAQSIQKHENQLIDSSRHPTQLISHVFVDVLLPAISAVFNVPERSIRQRDATEVAIALELWHRRHGNWPASLDQLVPDLLPAVPPDRIDGQPLRYVVRDGKPVVYSLGNDRNDDGGRPPTDPNKVNVYGYGQLDAKTLERYQTPDHDGDWILWPPLPEKPEDDD